ncbi:MAG: thermonuclease family protein [Synergistales bacterium]|nr:thermonuclease family protein [Synergistales bacterium]
MKRLLQTGTALLLLLVLCGRGAAPAQQFQARVTEVIDGDTVTCRTEDGRELDVRYLLIDTPETHHPRRGREELGGTAAAANRSLVAGRTVTLETDLERYDRYGRLLAYVWKQGDRERTLINAALVARGLAMPFVLPPNDTYVAPIRQAFRRARQKERGLWKKAAGRRYTAEQAWTELTSLKGRFITLGLTVDRIEESGSSSQLIQEGVPLRVKVYHSDRRFLPRLASLRGTTLVMVGKLRAAYRGGLVILRDRIQIMERGEGYPQWFHRYSPGTEELQRP